MKIEVINSTTTTFEIDPMEIVKRFPVEWKEHLEGADAERRGGYDDEDVRDFVKETLHEIGLDILEEFPGTGWETDQDTEINFY